MPRLTAVARALKAYVDRALIAHGVHAGQQFILQRLWREDGLTPGELARRTGVETPTVVRAVNRMEASGLLARRKDLDDARLVRVYLTARGKELEGILPAVLHRLNDEALSGLSADERRQLDRLLERVGRNLGADT